MHEATVSKLRHEIAQLDSLFDSFRPVRELASISAPDLVQLAALGTFLHSFYGGVENLLLTIAKHVDGQVPSGNRWHKALLMQMGQDRESRGRLLDETVRVSLLAYLSFRHFFRNAYAYNLDWDQMRPMVEESERV